LIWGFHGEIVTGAITLERQIDWNPSVTNLTEPDNRLPTIKELIRLFTYSGSQGILDPIIKNWLDNGCRYVSAPSTPKPCNEVEITLQDRNRSGARGAYTETKEGYLISSSYRDIDGVNSNSGSQIFGIRIKDGKVVVFEAGDKGGVFSEYRNRDHMLALCPGLLTNAGGDITGGCDYRVTQDTNDYESTDAANYAVVPVYALLVKTTQLVQ
jgi:hypothetical protein